jgi:hypothetical protein
MNGTWNIVGEGFSGNPGNTTNTNTGGYADFAEWIPYSGDAQPQPGDVLTVGDSPVTVKGSVTPYDPHMLGIVSTTPYDVGGADDGHSVIMALNGRVPVNISSTSDAIQPGDYLTTSGDSGKAMKATGAGFVIGKALAAWDPASGETQVMVFVEPGYWPGPTNAQYLQNGGSADFSSLNVSGTATINNLTVTTLNATTATIGTLTVTGSAQFSGNITVGGHVITDGGQPTSEAQTAAGASATVSVDGTDTTGTITVTTGSAPSAGDLAKIIFSKVYDKAPHVVLSPSNDKAAGLRFYKGNTSTTDFMFNSLDTPQANTTYTFDYFIAE